MVQSCSAKKETGKTILFAAGIIVFVALISFCKHRNDEINYLNSDATWHALLTIKAYDETPIAQHLFLPIVSLGGEDDKWIPWGATIPDKNGNYYYTSFSPAGYFVPWLFMKAFQLPTNEKSLYIFNALLLILSANLWCFFILMVYRESRHKYILGCIGAATYVLSPELLHGMGVVYWHHSLMQATLLVQLIAYYRMCKSGSASAKAVFYMMALANPYIEWSGYVANAGFALSELFIHWKKNRRSACIRVFILTAITLLSFGLFAAHYLLRVDATAFFRVLKARFLARNLSTGVALADLFGSYFKSFLYIWVLLLILTVWNFIKNEKIECRKGILLLLLAAPLLENIIMKQHALSYTYDRMKGIFVISFLVCELSDQLLKTSREKIGRLLIALAVLAGIMNVRAYVRDSSYIWKTGYQGDNMVLAKYLKENYADSVLGLEKHAVRGYVNILLGRGVYEWKSAEQLKRIAVDRGKTHAIVIHVEGGAWNLYEISGATIYDVDSGEVRQLRVAHGEIVLAPS